MEKVEEAVLVTGSSSWLGRSLVQGLKNEFVPIVASYRNCLPEPQERVYPVLCDLKDSKMIPAALRGVRTVFHLAWGGGLGAYEEDNLSSISNLVQAAETEGVLQFIFISAIGAHRNSSSKFLQEKYKAEQVLINSKIPKITIWRSAPLFGGVVVSDRFIRSLYNAAKMPLFHPEQPQGKLSPLDKGDFIKLILEQYRGEASGVNIFNASGPDEVEIGELLYEIAFRSRKGISLGIKGRVGDFLLRFLERDQKFAGRRLADYGLLKNLNCCYEHKKGKQSLKTLFQTLPQHELNSKVIPVVSKPSETNA